MSFINDQQVERMQGKIDTLYKSCTALEVENSALKAALNDRDEQIVINKSAYITRLAELISERETLRECNSNQFDTIVAIRNRVRAALSVQ